MSKLTAIYNFVSVRWIRKFSDREKLEKYQKKMVRKQLLYMKKHSPFYANIDVDDFASLPIMDKKSMMENFDKLNTHGLNRDEALSLAIESEKSRDFTPKYKGISVGLSSGTSGHRGLFVVSDKETMQWAGAVLAKLLPKGHILNHKVAFFLRADNNLYETINSPVLTFEFFDLLKPMEEHIARLKEFPVTILVAPPSVLKELAKEQEKGSLNISPEKIISVAEVLNEADERYIKKVFGKEIIHQVYQCTEGFLACTCECGKIHLNEDIVFIEKEYIGENRFVPVITDYRRSSQPIIRYRLNDVLRESKEKCECGNPSLVIEKIEGREDDIFIFSKDGKDVCVFADFISRCMVYVDDIREYRVEQISRDEIIIYIDRVDDKTKEDTIKEFKRLSEKMNFDMPRISFEAYVTTPGRKVKRVERRFEYEKN
ncbi:MAG: CoF synthetase [Lachnospiraceae bacterium]|nr:CoF synthetase [Lachnospiraceae bacterium]